MNLKMKIKIYSAFFIFVTLTLICPLLTKVESPQPRTSHKAVFSFFCAERFIKDTINIPYTQNKSNELRNPKISSSSSTDLNINKYTIQKVLSAESEEENTYLLKINNPDINYNPQQIKLDEKNRILLEHLVMGEAGTEGFIGCALVAQTIRDTLHYENTNDVEKIRQEYKYDANLKNSPNDDVKAAVQYIFDEGQSVVQHKLLFFYETKLCSSEWHETQNYVVTYRTTRFFDQNI